MAFQINRVKEPNNQNHINIWSRIDKTTLANNDILMYNSSTERWENKEASTDLELDHNFVVVGAPPSQLPSSRQLAVQAGHLSMNDGGAGNSVTLSLPNSGVTAGSYTLMSGTVDAQGRLTAASSTTIMQPVFPLLARGFHARFFDSQQITPGSPVKLAPWASDPIEGSFYALDHNFGGEFNTTTGEYTVPEKGPYTIYYDLLVDVEDDNTSFEIEVRIEDVIEDQNGPITWVLMNEYKTEDGVQSVTRTISGIGLNAGSKVSLWGRAYGESFTVRHNDRHNGDNFDVSRFGIMPNIRFI